MAVTKQKKQEDLQELIASFKGAKSIAVGKANGLTVAEVSDLRRKLREQNVTYKVSKKTLICIAAKEAGYDVDKAVLEGSVGLAFGPDEISAVKGIKTFDPKSEKLALIGAFYDGKYLSKAIANELASIPGKQELLGKFLGIITSPLNSFAGMLNSPLSSFARAVKAYSETKSA